ncbi:hypothetical protein J437_LFUL008837 [Ladona fulva]|uniref:Uncharacterized protein n=1 Tax=Ladona fulva TaxID=123851 RepID=A0A8K0P683_LADFU|nr:hypothetical protein J437_LFUL008837 [Ladona fulva]
MKVEEEPNMKSGTDKMTGTSLSGPTRCLKFTWGSMAINKLKGNERCLIPESNMQSVFLESMDFGRPFARNGGLWIKGDKKGHMDNLKCKGNTIDLDITDHHMTECNIYIIVADENKIRMDQSNSKIDFHHLRELLSDCAWEDIYSQSDPTTAYGRLEGKTTSFADDTALSYAKSRYGFAFISGVLCVTFSPLRSLNPYSCTTKSLLIIGGDRLR